MQLIASDCLEVLRSGHMDFRIRKVDDELQVVYGEVYAPNVPDSQGDFMSAVEVRKMAHRFMESRKLDSIDTQHDNVLNGSVVVESFIARNDDTVYLPEAWVVGVHVPDEQVWKKIKSGEINGFSMEAMIRWEERIIEIEVPPVITGRTHKSEGGDHDHVFQVKIGEDGEFLGGRTDTAPDGHWHDIRHGTATEPGGKDQHNHRFSILEAVDLVGVE